MDLEEITKDGMEVVVDTSFLVAKNQRMAWAYAISMIVTESNGEYVVPNIVPWEFRTLHGKPDERGIPLKTRNTPIKDLLDLQPFEQAGFLTDDVVSYVDHLPYDTTPLVGRSIKLGGLSPTDKKVVHEVIQRSEHSPVAVATGDLRMAATLSAYNSPYPITIHGPWNMDLTVSSSPSALLSRHSVLADLYHSSREKLGRMTVGITPMDSLFGATSLAFAVFDRPVSHEMVTALPVLYKDKNGRFYAGEHPYSSQAFVYSHRTPHKLSLISDLTEGDWFKIDNQNFAPRRKTDRLHHVAMWHLTAFNHSAYSRTLRLETAISPELEDHRSAPGFIDLYATPKT